MFLDIIYPPRCVYCYDIIGVGGPKFVCIECEKEVEYIEGDACRWCGCSLDSMTEACPSCVKRDFSFSRNHALFIYEGNIREAIHRYKYKNKKRYAEYFGKIMTQHFLSILTDSDLITGVPLHRKKLKARGYNQSELLAAEIAKNTDILHAENILLRVRNTKAQSKLPGRSARENNIKGAFQLRDGCDIKGKKIILVDDIFTTGSTLNECAKILLSNGAESVMGLTLSVVPSDHDASKKSDFI